MECESLINNSKNNERENNLKKKEPKMKKNPKFMMKLDLGNMDLYKVGENTYRNLIIIVHEISNKKIGVLFNYVLLIYSLNNFKLLQMIEQDFKSKNEDNIYNFEFIGFIELKNCNLVLWNKQEILIYKSIGKKYELHQKINEFEQGTKRVVYDDYFHRDDIYYEISCVYELLNGNLVSGNSYGLKIYEKK